jgi:hypothetical protein
MKRLNRVNFTIFIITIIAVQLWLILWLAEILDEWLYLLETIIFLFLIWFTIFWWILIIKRSHDFWARWGRHIIWTMLIPFYILYLVFKKWDIWNNSYWKVDTKILFWEKDNKRRENIFEIIFYNIILWPVISEKLKDKIIWTKKGRIGVIIYTLLYITLSVIYLIIVLNILYSEEEKFIAMLFILLWIIPYKFILPLYFSVSSYIKWK